MVSFVGGFSPKFIYGRLPEQYSQKRRSLLQKPCAILFLTILLSIQLLTTTAEAHNIIDVIPRIGASVHSRVASIIPPSQNGRGTLGKPKQVITANGQVTSDPANEPQNEPTIAIDPIDNSLVAAGANDYRLVAQGHDAWLGVYISKNNGTTWTDSLLPGYPGGTITPLSGYTTGSEPAIAFDLNGRLYYSGIVFVRQSSGAGIDGTVFAAHSTDNGTNWVETIVALGSNTRRGSVFNDKPYIAIDTIANSAFKGRIYLSWTGFVNTNPGVILFSESMDGGSTFSSPTTISSVPTDEMQSSVPYVGPNGIVYVTWEDTTTNHIIISKSTNGGTSFSAPITVTAVIPLPANLPNSSFRENSFPTLAVDPVGGTVYIAWDDYRNGNSDIFLTRSTDKAATFSGPVKLNDDTTTNDQFFPWIQSVSGKIAAVWYDRRLDPGNHNMDTFYSESINQGLAWSPNVRLSSVSSNPDCCGFLGQFIGDYVGMALTSSTARAVWMDTRNGNQDIFTERYPPLPKVSITGIALPRNIMYNQISSKPLNATIIVKNDAPYDETITVAFSLQNITGTIFLSVNQTAPLLSSATVNLTFTVQTQNLPRGNYTMIAHVFPVKGQTDISNNTMTSLLQVHIPGDINGDGVVNIIDLVAVGSHFGARRGDPNYLPAADLNNDGVIDIIDITIVGSTFGRTG